METPIDLNEWKYPEEAPRFVKAKRFIAWIKGTGHPKTSRALYRIEPVDGDEAPYEQDRSTDSIASTPKRGAVAAVARTLEALPLSAEVTIYTKDDFIVGALMRGDLQNWKPLGWKRSPKERLAAADIWRRVDRIIRERNLKVTVVHALSKEASKIDSLGARQAA